MAALGTQQLSLIRSSSGYIGELPALAALLDADDDLGVEQALSLSSRPSAKNKLVLDFDGHVLEGSAWNEVAERDRLVSAAYDKDGDPNSFHAEEIADIVAIWRAVAEDYAAFDVDVTTADPGDAALEGIGQRAVIGGAAGDWYGVAGGIAYVNSFGKRGMPCFIFSLSLGPNNPKFIWEAVSHELGHTLGLLHDGIVPNPGNPNGLSYTTGQGLWAPIMGMSYYAEVTQFDAGEFPFSNNQQDDLAVIATKLPRLPQQHGSSINAATPLAPSTSRASGMATTAVRVAASSTFTVTSSGILSSTGQRDFFSFEAGAGLASIAVAVTAPFGIGAFTRANLKASATVYDASGAVLATLTPPKGFAMAVPESTVLLPAAGVYYVSVSGTGADTPATGGYSNYGSLGWYALTVTARDPAAPLSPDCLGSWTVNGGAACQFAEGAVKSQSCSGGDCLQPPTAGYSDGGADPSDSVMVITALKVTREVPVNPNSRATGRAVQYYRCKAIITLRTASGGVMANATVTGTWSAPGEATPDAAAAPADTRRSGQAVFWSQAWRAAGAAGLCEFTVRDVQFTGKTFDRSSSFTSSAVNWD
ncbi:hypothetical protein OEZ86_002023 [Tetradesmus obliquus]|nr:hypothetical protein OEZ86_002023 [Tetradesmus obliquus]